MNHPDMGQAARAVHRICGKSYLKQELEILQPEILITQGNAANEFMGKFLLGKPINNKNMPAGFTFSLWGDNSLWLPMRHPARQVPF